jgi:hypothetical protein
MCWPWILFCVPHPVVVTARETKISKSRQQVKPYMAFRCTHGEHVQPCLLFLWENFGVRQTLRWSEAFSRGRLKKTGEIHKWLYVCLFVTLNNIFSRCCWMTFCKISPSALKKKLSQLFFYDSAVLILPAFCVRLRQLKKNRRRDSKNKSQTIIPVLIIFSHMCVCIYLVDTCFFYTIPLFLCRLFIFFEINGM